MRFQRGIKSSSEYQFRWGSVYIFISMETEWAAALSLDRRGRYKSVDNYHIKLVSVVIHLAGRLSCICLHLLKSWWEINEEAGLQLSVALERINGFSVNMTVSLDLHRYEDEVSEEKLHDDSSLLSLTTRTWLLLDNFCRVANLLSFLPLCLTWWKIT